MIVSECVHYDIAVTYEHMLCSHDICVVLRVNAESRRK